MSGCSLARAGCPENDGFRTSVASTGLSSSVDAHIRLLAVGVQRACSCCGGRKLAGLGSGMPALGLVVALGWVRELTSSSLVLGTAVEVEVAELGRGVLGRAARVVDWSMSEGDIFLLRSCWCGLVYSLVASRWVVDAGRCQQEAGRMTW